MSSISAQSQAVLDLRNHTPQNLTIELDGTTLIKLAGGSSTRLNGVPAGRHTLVARVGTEIVLETSADLPSAGTYVWTLGDSDAMRGGAPLLRVRNYAGETVKLFVESRYRIDIDPGDAATLTGFTVGPVELEARSAEDVVLSRATLEMVGGLERVWTIEAQGGATAVLSVRNGTSSQIRVRIDDGEPQLLEAGGEMQLSAVAPGVHRLEAFDVSTGALVQRLEAEMQADASHEWTVTAEAEPPL